MRLSPQSTNVEDFGQSSPTIGCVMGHFIYKLDTGAQKRGQEHCRTFRGSGGPVGHVTQDSLGRCSRAESIRGHPAYRTRILRVFQHIPQIILTTRVADATPFCMPSWHSNQGMKRALVHVCKCLDHVALVGNFPSVVIWRRDGSLEMDRRLSEKIHDVTLTTAMSNPLTCFMNNVRVGQQMNLIFPPSMQHTRFKSPGAVS